MKIISVIVDEMPENCHECDQIIFGSNIHTCQITWCEIECTKTKDKPSWCPLRVMPSDEEIEAVVQEEKIFDYMPETLKTHISAKQASKLKGINWLKSKLT